MHPLLHGKTCAFDGPHAIPRTCLNNSTSATCRTRPAIAASPNQKSSLACCHERIVAMLGFVLHNPNVVVDHFDRQQVRSCSLHVSILCERHVATNAVVGNLVSQLSGHSTMLDLVTLQTSLGKRFGISPLIFMGIVTRRASHFRLLKTLTH